MKFYNGATVWGKLDKFSQETTANGKHYIEVYIACPHAQYGNVRILGRIWGQEAVNAFMDDVRLGTIKKGAELRLEGNMQQYGKDGEVKTSFNFYRCETGTPLKEFKAAFRLTGEVVAFDAGVKADGFHPLKIRIIQEQKEDFTPKVEEFELCVPMVSLLEMPDTPTPDQALRVKGYIECPEDEFGGADGTQRPVVRIMEVIDNG